MAKGKQKARKTSRERLNAPASGSNLTDYRVEAVVTLDPRGQIVLPKEVRLKAGIRPGDKLTVVTSSPGGKLCCINLFKTEELAGVVKRLLGPMAHQI